MTTTLPPMTSADPAPTAPPTFTGPDGGEYRYADPAESPLMDDTDSTTVPPPEGAPEDEHPELPWHAESTPPDPAAVAAAETPATPEPTAAPETPAAPEVTS